YLDLVESRISVSQRETVIVCAREADSGLRKPFWRQCPDVVHGDALRADRAQVSFAASTERVFAGQQVVRHTLLRVAQRTSYEEVAGVLKAMIDADIKLIVRPLSKRDY